MKLFRRRRFSGTLLTMNLRPDLFEKAYLSGKEFVELYSELYMSERTKIAMSKLEYDKKIDSIKVCGTNRGPHDYIPLVWNKANKDFEKIEMLICRICFCRVKVDLLEKEFDEIKIQD